MPQKLELSLKGINQFDQRNLLKRFCIKNQCSMGKRSIKRLVQILYKRISFFQFQCFYLRYHCKQILQPNDVYTICLKDLMNNLLIQSLEDCLFPFRGIINYIFQLTLLLEQEELIIFQFDSRSCTVRMICLIFSWNQHIQEDQIEHQMRSPPTIYDSPKNAEIIKITK